MGIGNELIGDVERLLTKHTLDRQSLFRMSGHSSQSWRAETEIEQMYPGMRCLLLPSATIGLSLIFEVLNLKPGSEVLITPFGWLSNWSCIRRAGLIPRFLPLNDALQVDYDQVTTRISERTGAVIVTHLMGRGQQAVPQLAEYCCQHGIPLLEDIAQSFGISVKGRRAGTFGVGAWCSLNRHKMLSTGDGGFVLVKDRDVFARLCALHDQGCVLDKGKRTPAATLEPGLSLRVPELSAAILRSQLARFHLVRSRILNYNRLLTEECEAIPSLRMIPTHHGDVPFTVLFGRPSEMNYPSLADSGWHIAPNVTWLATAFQDAMKADTDLANALHRLKVTSAIGAGFVDPYYSVPLGLRITDPTSEIVQVISALRSTL